MQRCAWIEISKPALRYAIKPQTALLPQGYLSYTFNCSVKQILLVWRGFGSVNFSASAVPQQLGESLHQPTSPGLGCLVGAVRKQESDLVILVGLFQFGTLGKQRLCPAVGSHPCAEQ